MRTLISIGLVVMCIVGIASAASGKTWTVCSSGCCDYDEIQAAVDGATPGDTINVYEGNWEGAIISRKFLTIQGQCGRGPVCRSEMRARRAVGQAAAVHRLGRSSSSSSSSTSSRSTRARKHSKGKKHNQCKPDRVKIISGPALATGVPQSFAAPIPTVSWQAGFIVVDTAVHISGFKFLCETVESTSDADLAVGVSVQSSSEPGSYGGSIVGNSFHECHRAVQLLGAGQWRVAENRFTIGSEVAYTGSQAQDNVLPCSFVFITNHYRFPGANNVATHPTDGTTAPSQNVIEDNTGVISANPNEINPASSNFFSCSFVGIYGSPINTIPTEPSIINAVLVLSETDRQIQIPQSNIIRRNTVEGRPVDADRPVYGVFQTLTSFNLITENVFTGFTSDVMHVFGASRNFVYRNDFSSAVADSIVLGWGAFSNNITHNLIRTPAGDGIDHRDPDTNLGQWTSNGAHLITDNTVLYPGDCGIRYPNPTIVDAFPDIIYNNVATTCIAP